MDPDNMTIVEYKRENVLKYLNLNVDNIPLFIYLNDLKSMTNSEQYVSILHKILVFKTLHVFFNCRQYRRNSASDTKNSKTLQSL